MDQQTEVFRPIGARYLVLPDEVKETGVEVGEYTIKTDKDVTKKPARGTIVAKGSGCKEPLNPGDRILFGKYSGYTEEINGVEHKVLQESELLGELCKTPFDK